MRILKQTRREFHGTHKGASIDIDRELDGRFYIIVTASSGGYLYEGWAPEGITTMAAAKKEAIRGACLNEA